MAARAGAAVSRARRRRCARWTRAPVKTRRGAEGRRGEGGAGGVRPVPLKRRRVATRAQVAIAAHAWYQFDAHCSALVAEDLRAGRSSPFVDEFADQSLSPTGCAPLAWHAAARARPAAARRRARERRAAPLADACLGDASPGSVNSALGGIQSATLWRAHRRNCSSRSRRSSSSGTGARARRCCTSSSRSTSGTGPRRAWSASRRRIASSAAATSKSSSSCSRQSGRWTTWPSAGSGRRRTSSP